MPNKAFACYNDGFVSIYREKGIHSNFQARINPRDLTSMDFVVKLAYARTSKRQQDITFAEQNGFSLTLKIRTRFVNGVDNKCKAVINGYLYDIKYVDETRTDLFLYMEGIGELVTDD